jgi:hypothetical protein
MLIPVRGKRIRNYDPGPQNNDAEKIRMMTGMNHDDNDGHVLFLFVAQTLVSIMDY